MEIKRRISKLLETVRPLADMHRKAQRMSRLKGAPMATILDAIEAATAPGDRPILEEICEQCEEYGKAWPDDHHGWWDWTRLLQTGAASLPDRLPRSVLIAWQDAYTPRWDLQGRPWTPRPFWICGSCKMALPHRPGWDGPCPICDSPRILQSDFSKPLGRAWIDCAASSHDAA